MKGGRVGRWVTAAVGLGAALAAVGPTAQASFPGRDGAILFSRNESSAVTTLWKVSPSGGRGSRLTAPSRSCRRGYWADFAPAVSPTGDRIAYAHEDDCNPATPDGIYTMRSDGGGRRLLVPSVDRRFWLDWPAFDPDGGIVVFVRRNVETSDSMLWATPLRGSEAPVPWASGPLLFERWQDDPEWSAGGRLAVSVVGIWTVWSSGRMTRPSRALADYAPSWHPSGTRLAFQRLYERPGDQPSVGTIFTAPASARRPPTRLLAGRSSLFPAWSPNGDRLAYVRAPRGLGTTGELVVLHMPDGRARRVATGVAAERIAWQPRPR